MKEALICVLIALFLGAAFNSLRGLDVWGTAQTAGTPASTVLLVTESTFEKEVFNSQVPVLVDFFSDDNAASKEMVPVLAEAAKALGSSYKIVRIDASESPQLTKMLNIEKLPDFLFFKQGAEIDHIQGKLSNDELITFIRKCMEDQTSTETAPEILDGILGGMVNKATADASEGAQSDSDTHKESSTESSSGGDSKTTK